jgi:hypothetical protein
MSRKTAKPPKIKSPMGETMRFMSGLDGMEAETVAVIAELFGNLLAQNWSQIKACRDRSDDAAVSISFGFDVDNSGKLPLVRAKIGYAQKFKDQLESFVEDPDQPGMDFDGDAQKERVE